VTVRTELLASWDEKFRLDGVELGLLRSLGVWAGNWLVGLPSEFLGQFVPAVQKVTAEQVREIGKKYFAPETQTWVVVGDPAAIGEQLKGFGEFTTVK
jgi:zinc protease